MRDAIVAWRNQDDQPAGKQGPDAHATRTGTARRAATATPAGQTAAPQAAVGATHRTRSPIACAPRPRRAAAIRARAAMRTSVAAQSAATLTARMPTSRSTLGAVPRISEKCLTSTVAGSTAITSSPGTHQHQRRDDDAGDEVGGDETGLADPARSIAAAPRCAGASPAPPRGRPVPRTSPPRTRGSAGNPLCSAAQVTPNQMAAAPPARRTRRRQCHADDPVAVAALGSEHRAAGRSGGAGSGQE